MDVGENEYLYAVVPKGHTVAPATAWPVHNAADLLCDFDALNMQEAYSSASFATKVIDSGSVIDSAQELCGTSRVSTCGDSYSSNTGDGLGFGSYDGYDDGSGSYAVQDLDDPCINNPGAAGTSGANSSAEQAWKAQKDARAKEAKRGQGYRKLWQQVTRVGKGQKLAENAGVPFSDMTVEDLLKIVFKLAPHESAVEGVEQGLYFLDSSALAALLKELAKQGQLKRSVEIFDWLRSLEPTHELAALCDLYTYTTMISQCGSHQQLRRALELVAEMRSRGIECNVHTYSALMNVCIKANELELARDVYRQMLEEGCTPNLVTYNILIDVHVKQGQWEEAIKVLDTLDRQGIQAEVRTYNTVISACNKSGQPEQALQVYERMLNAGVKPSATTYTALISAYGKKGQVEKAMEIFQDMIRRGCERNVITYSSLISACEKAGRWELALDLFNKMHSENCKPNVVTYNSLIAACAHGGHWEKASEFFEQMQSQGCKPDSITYSALITAFERGGQWRRALKAFEQMQSHCCHADAAVFNSLMEVLWQSGVILAQVRALQLWSTANRVGHFRIYTHTKDDTELLQYSSVSFTAGAAIVTVIRWLAELLTKLVKEGPAFFKKCILFTLHKSKQNRAEQPLSVIHEGLSATLAGAGSPFDVALVEQTITLKTTAEQLIEWLRSPEFANLTYMVYGSHFKRLTLDLIFSEDVAVAARCIEAFSAVRKFEDAHAVNSANIPPTLVQQRNQIVHLALKYGAAFGFKEDTVYDGIQLLDRAVCSGVAINSSLWPLMLCCSILLSARQSEPAQSWPSYEHILLVSGFSGDALTNMERNLYAWLQQDTSVISPLRVGHLYLERLGYYLQEFKSVDRISKELNTIVFKTACSPNLIGCKPSHIAASILYVLRKMKGMVPFWPTALASMTGFANLQSGELANCVSTVTTLVQNS